MSRKKKQQAIETEQKNATPPAPPEEHTTPHEGLNESQPSEATAAADAQTNGEVPAETEAPSEAEKTVDKGAVIDPIAFEIKLKSIHPQATYGRCGYRFNKETAVEIARADLIDEQIITLANDPYLEFVPVVEGDA